MGRKMSCRVQCLFACCACPFVIPPLVCILPYRLSLPLAVRELCFAFVGNHKGNQRVLFFSEGESKRRVDAKSVQEF